MFGQFDLICLKRFSHMHINCALCLYDEQQVAGDFSALQNQAPPLWVPLNRHHLFSPWNCQPE